MVAAKQSMSNHFRSTLFKRRRWNPLATTAESSSAQRGFTLVELMVVMAIIAVLMAVAVPSFVSALRSAREAALRQDLHTMRDAIEQYTEDKEAAPQSLDDLVQAGYLKSLPIDPMTHSNTTWVAAQSDSYSSVDQSQTGINDVHSGSDLVGSNGEPYSQW
jgi:general secretion pathway protein G